jgi:hypothetical protein
MTSPSVQAASTEGAAADEVQAVVFQASDFLVFALLVTVVVLVLPKQLKRLFSTRHKPHES